MCGVCPHILCSKRLEYSLLVFYFFFQHHSGFRPKTLNLFCYYLSEPKHLTLASPHLHCSTLTYIFVHLKIPSYVHWFKNSWLCYWIQQWTLFVGRYVAIKLFFPSGSVVPQRQFCFYQCISSVHISLYFLVLL